MTEPNQIANEIDDNKNKNCVRCQFCSSLILKPKSADYMKNEFPLPMMHQKKSNPTDSVESESLDDYWLVNDMFTFENIGFSNSVANVKYLVCADCDMGPLGYHDITTKKCYISLIRVVHREPTTTT